MVETSANHYDFYEKLPEEKEITITVNKTEEGFKF
jgi:translation elongation factor EF-Tu-like GTPase